MQISRLDYIAGGQRFTGYLADGSGGKRVPGILVAHEGGGMSEHPQMRARMLAEDGYVALVMDTYGPRVQTREQGIAEMNRLLGDLPDLRLRTRAALSALKAPRRSTRTAPPPSAFASAAGRCWNSPAQAQTPRPWSVFTAGCRPQLRKTPRASPAKCWCSWAKKIR